jgi:hypothetical protein
MQEKINMGYFKVENINNLNPKTFFNDISIKEEDFTVDSVTNFIGSGIESIKVIKNFMNYEEILLLNKLCDLNYKNIHCEYDEVKMANKILSDYKDKILFKAQELFKIKLIHDDAANELNIKSNYLNGRKPYFATDIHTDLLEDQQNNLKYTWSGHISNLLYLNDNYSGGELYFFHHDLKIKPEPGMLVSFPGNWYNRHAIMPASDYRYAINIFTKIVNFPNYLEYK